MRITLGRHRPRHGWHSCTFFDTQLGCHATGVLSYCTRNLKTFLRNSHNPYRLVSGSKATLRLLKALPFAKHLITLVTLSLLMLINVTESYAATYYWVGSPGGNTNSASNWVTTNPTSCTGGGAGVPGATDDIIFDPDCDNNATINTNLVANTYTIQAGYTGTITQNSGVTISTPSTGSGVDWTQADGTFVGGNSDISFYRDFLITGGTFTSTSGTLYFARNFTVSGGTFNHNGGTLSFALLGATSCGSGRSINAPNVVFNLFTINRPFTANVSCNLSIAAGTTIPLGNSPTITLTSSGGGGTTGLIVDHE